MDDLYHSWNRLSLRTRRQEFSPIKVEKDVEIVKKLFRLTPMSNEWAPMSFRRVHTLHKVASRKSAEYIRFINGLNYPHAQGYYGEIFRVQNPFLYVQCQLKLKQKKQFHKRVKQRQLYHGTKLCNLDSICDNNFDWRKIGQNKLRSSKFGRGISFSPSPRYAADYPRRCDDDPRSMIVAKVMEVSRCKGFSNMKIPPLPHDTSAKPGDGNVVVKYFDNKFYPEYIIYYS